jgi:uncharacterized repeat protein (TIGR03803 family)
MHTSRSFVSAGLVALLASVTWQKDAKAAGNYSVVYSFTGGSDGSQPNQLTTDSAGNIYGTTEYGGAGTCLDRQSGACGTVFKMTPTGQMTVLATFNGQNGAFPIGPVTLAAGTLYGTATQGGTTNDGVVFSVGTDGRNFQILHQFSGNDGYSPGGTLLIEPGAVYGVAAVGGPFGLGVLYKINKGEKYLILHAFKKQDGANPTDIRFAPGGAIEGSAPYGGTGCSSGPGCGTIFYYEPQSATFMTLYQFTGHNDGADPSMGTIDGQGNLFGVTGSGSVNTTGTLFELSPGPNGATLGTLVNFSAATGNYPGGGPALLPTGQLLGGTDNSIYLYDPLVAHDGALLVNETSFPEFGGPAAFGPDRTAYINARQGGAGLNGQIWSIATAAP